MGNFGAVLYGTHNATGNRVAVKIQRSSPEATYEVTMLQRITQMAHPHRPPMLPRLYGHCEHNGWHYLVMDGDAPDDDSRDNGWREWFEDALEGEFLLTDGQVDKEVKLAEVFVQIVVVILVIFR